MKATDIFKSTLAAAENSYNSAFGVITKIQNTAEKATEAAAAEADKAAMKRIEYQLKEEEMTAKKNLYERRAAKIAKFIEELY